MTPAGENMSPAYYRKHVAPGVQKSETGIPCGYVRLDQVRR